VQQEHRVEEGGVPRERREVDRVGGDQPERDEKQAIEPPLQGRRTPAGLACGRAEAVIAFECYLRKDRSSRRGRALGRALSYRCGNG
jgi:hypothetical protein